MSAWRKIYKKWSHQHPELKAQFAKKIVQFETDPFSSGAEDPYVERSHEGALVVQDYVRTTARL